VQGTHQTTDVDELLDRAGDAVARNDWALARRLAETVLETNRGHSEAELILKTANAYLDTSVVLDPFPTSQHRRFMSMMFCDVVSSTTLTQKLGDEAWSAVLEGFRRRCARAVRRYDGYIHEVTGDQLLILFGYPRVREDDARRAVLAGLDIVTAIQSFSTVIEKDHGICFRVRVGIHTGRAQIRERSQRSDLQGSATEIGDGLVGEAAIIAKRIESEAAPNTVWVSSATRRIVEGFFHFLPAGEGEKTIELGVDSAVTAYQVNGRTAALNRHQIATVRSDEMIGRRTERGDLLRLWENVPTEGAPFVVVSGPAGIGKSTLVQFLAETAAGSRARRLECICTEILKPVALAPLIGVIERFANIRQTDGGETRLSKLDSAFRELAPELGQFVPYLAWMMSIPGSVIRDIEELEPDVIRSRAFDALVKILKLASSIRPTLLWFEDLQWADHSTQEFCRRLHTSGRTPGLMVIATMRTHRGASQSILRWSDEQLNSDGIVMIELGPLSAAESRELIAARSGSLPDEAFTQTVLESTGGNPLYIEEVVRSLGTRPTPAYQSTERHSVAVPESLQPIFAQIVDRLGTDRSVAQIASLLGRDLPEPLTRSVVASLLNLTEDQVLQSLVRLIEAEIVEPLLTELSPGFRFRHELIREALVHSVGSDARGNHDRIVSVIERSFPEYAHERPAVIAYHCGKAERNEKAATYWLAAGTDFQARAAHQEAIASIDKGLEALSRVSTAAETVKLAQLELSLCASRGVSVQTMRGYADERAGVDWARAYELSKQIGATGALVPALLGLWSFYFVKGAHKTSIDVATQMVDAAGIPDDLEASLIGHVCLSYSRYFCGDLIAARKSAELSRLLHDKVKDRPPAIHVPQDPALAGLSLLGPLRWTLGDQVGGLKVADESRSFAKSLESKRAINLSRIGQYIAWLHQIRRAPREALLAAEEALVVAQNHRIDWAVVCLSIHKGLAMAHLNASQDGIREAAAIVNENIGYWRAIGAECMVPYFLGQLAEAHHHAGNQLEALRLLEQAIEMSNRIGEHFHDAELHRVCGQVRLALGDTETGIESLLAAVGIAQNQHAVSFEIRAISSLLTSVPELADRVAWIDRLESVIENLESSEGAQEERNVRVLIANERRKRQ
jgi:class 3 adenylate cyclase/tetratricopeptide (TPR) repeat protein